jgi:MerR family Zn(II)-responsive transcriptional regulator of zntA
MFPVCQYAHNKINRALRSTVKSDFIRGKGGNMRIGELCAKAGLSKDTVRYYERLGLLEKIPQPNGSNNYKVYSAVDLQRLKMIKHAKMLGFTLAEISDVLAVWIEDQFTVAQKQACLHRKLEQLEEKAKALAELRAGLINALNKVGERCVDVF